MNFKKINKIILTFFLAVMFFLLLVWQFFHSREFASIVSNKVSEITVKHYDVAVKFDELNLDIYPPGIGFKGVNILYSSEQVGFQTQFDHLHVKFNIFDFFSQKASFEKVIISGGHLSILKTESNVATPNESFDLMQIEHQYKEIKKTIKSLPFKLTYIALEQLELNYNQFSLDIDELTLKLDREKINTSFSVINHKISRYSVPDYVKGNIELTDSINLKQLEIFQKENKVSLFGTSSFDLNEIDLQGLVDLNLAQVEKKIEIEKYLQVYAGEMYGDLHFKRSNNKNEVHSNLKIKNLNSNVLKTENVAVELSFSDNLIKLNSLVVNEKEGEIKNKSPFVVYDLNNSLVLPEKVEISANKYPVKNALTYIEALKPLNGLVTGDFMFQLEDNLDFVISHEKIQIDDLDVRFESDLVKLSKADLEKGLYQLKDDDFLLNIGLTTKGTSLWVDGKIQQKSMEIVINDSSIDVGQFELFLGVKGDGIIKGDIQFSGPLDQILMQANLQYEKLIIEDFYLGDGRTQLALDFENGLLNSLDLNGKVGSSLYKALVSLDIYNEKIELVKVDFIGNSTNELKLFHRPILDQFSDHLDNLTGTYKVNYQVRGGFIPSKLDVKGQLNLESVTMYDEFFPIGKIEFDFINNKFSVPKFEINKELGFISGKMDYDLNNDKMTLKASVIDIPLSKFNNYAALPSKLESRINSNFDYTSHGANKKIRADVNFSETHVDGIKLGDSKTILKIENKKWQFGVDLFGQDISAECVLDFTIKSTSKCDMNIDTDKLGILLEAALGSNIRNQDFESKVKFDLNASFDLNDMKTLNLTSTIYDLYLRRDDVSLSIDKTIPLEINNGLITPVNMSFTGSSARIHFIANGDLKQKFKLSIDGEFGASLLYLLGPKIIRTSGNLAYTFNLLTEDDLITPQVTLVTNDLELILDGLPFGIRKGDIKLLFDYNNLSIKKFDAEIDSGRIGILGDIKMNLPFPAISLTYSLNQAKLTLIDIADTSFTGSGTVTGAKPPYLITGDISIDRAVVRGLPEGVSDNVRSTLDNPYLPKVIVTDADALFRLNMGVKTLNPIRIINNMMDVSMGGEILLQGNLSNPRGQGAIKVNPSQSRVYFKNNEFLFSRGEVVFNFDKPIKEPNFDFAVLSQINEYKIYVRAYGGIDLFNFDFSSDPQLNQQDILSLIAFGYTDDMSRGLSDEDRQALGSIGIGTFLVDQLQIGRKLKQTLGVQLNLGTAFEQQNTSLLSNRGGDLETTGRVRSATRIELKKQLSDQLELSVSSTVGGSIGQRQSMNLNYNISEKVSLEGIYEIRTNEEGEEDIIDKSIGADIKFRWQF
jgi:translocation and assembly module TamB